MVPLLLSGTAPEDDTLQSMPFAMIPPLSTEWPVSDRLPMADREKSDGAAIQLIQHKYYTIYLHIYT